MTKRRPFIIKRLGFIAALFVLLAPLALQAASTERSIFISDKAIGLIGAEAAGKGAGTALQPYYPANNGALGEATSEFLYKGTLIDRYGGSGFSRFFSPAGTPAAARALPPGTASQTLRTFEVLKPFEVSRSTVAPAFGELGLGTQYRAPVTLDVLLKRGILGEVFK